jgi:hypothetical protein
VDVEQDHVGGELVERRERGLHRERLAHLEALELEVDAAEETESRIVVDDERGRTGVHRPAMLAGLL